MEVLRNGWQELILNPAKPERGENFSLPKVRDKIKIILWNKEAALLLLSFTCPRALLSSLGACSNQMPMSKNGK